MADDERAEAIRDRNRRIREEAAEKRRTKRATEARRPTLGQLEASEIVDDALARTTHAVAGFLRKHFTIVQWVIILGIAGGIGFQIYSHHRNKLEGQRTDALLSAVEEESARVGDEAPVLDPATGLEDSRPERPTHEERLSAAAAAYRKVADGPGEMLARIGLAGVLFDQGKHKDALAEYRRVRESPLASEDADVRARSIEGIGLSHEALGDLDAAQKAFHELGNQDSAVTSALGLYHQARMALKKGDRDKAKGQLVAALKKLSDAKIPSGYTEGMTRELLASIDPEAVPALPQQTLSPADLERLRKSAEQAGQDMSPERLNELLKQIASQSAETAPSASPSGPASSAAPVPSAPPVSSAKP